MREHYRSDLAVFCEAVEAPPESGPFYTLCGLTMENLFRKHERFADPVGFMCVQYVLNLLDQGIHTCFPEFKDEWRHESPPFLDLRACHSGHGGFSRSPGSIVWFVRNRWELPEAATINWDQCIGLYLQFFFEQYLPEVLPGLDVARLLKELIGDPDCFELRGLLPTNEHGQRS